MMLTKNEMAAVEYFIETATDELDYRIEENPERIYTQDDIKNYHNEKQDARNALLKLKAAPDMLDTLQKTASILLDPDLNKQTLYYYLIDTIQKVTEGE